MQFEFVTIVILIHTDLTDYKSYPGNYNNNHGRNIIEIIVTRYFDAFRRTFFLFCTLLVPILTIYKFKFGKCRCLSLLPFLSLNVYYKRQNTHLLKNNITYAVLSIFWETEETLRTNTNQNAILERIKSQQGLVFTIFNNIIARNQPFENISYKRDRDLTIMLK